MATFHPGVDRGGHTQTTPATRWNAESEKKKHKVQALSKMVHDIQYPMKRKKWMAFM